MPPQTQTTTTDPAAGEIVIQELGPETVQIDDKIYSARDLSSIHPGGELFVDAFAGRDATEAFLSYHRRSFPHSRYEKNAVGTASPKKESMADKDYLELCTIIEGILPRSKSFAPWYYYVKIFIIISCAIGLEAYIHITKSYVWYLCALEGLFMALIGLNIQHDANHGAISRNPRINRAFGLMQNYIGGSAIDWIHQHVVQHHILTNDVHHDPDLLGNTFLRINPDHPLLKHQSLQHLYIFPLIALFGVVQIYSSLMNTINGWHYIPMSKLLTKYQNFETFLSSLFIIRWLIIPLIQAPSVYTILNILTLPTVGGYYLAFFFIISHNFKGVHMFNDDAHTHKYDSFLYRQVTSSSNVGGSWLCFINGGLNYQIEHHLFPRIQHSHYPLIAPIVSAFCKTKDIPYVHFPTIMENGVATVEHLFAMGHQENKAFIEE